MTYSFDDNSFGVSDSRRTKINTVIVERPPQLSNSDWYKFAGKIADYFNNDVQLENQKLREALVIAKGLLDAMKWSNEDPHEGSFGWIINQALGETK